LPEPTSNRPHSRFAPDAREGVGSVGPVGRGADGCKTIPAWGPVGHSFCILGDHRQADEQRDFVRVSTGSSRRAISSHENDDRPLQNPVAQEGHRGLLPGFRNFQGAVE